MKKPRRKRAAEKPERRFGDFKQRVFKTDPTHPDDIPGGWESYILGKTVSIGPWVDLETARYWFMDLRDFRHLPDECNGEDPTIECSFNDWAPLFMVRKRDSDRDDDGLVHLEELFDCIAQEEGISCYRCGELGFPYKFERPKQRYSEYPIGRDHQYLEDLRLWMVNTLRPVYYVPVPPICYRCIRSFRAWIYKHQRHSTWRDHGGNLKEFAVSFEGWMASTLKGWSVAQSKRFRGATQGE